MNVFSKFAVTVPIGIGIFFLVRFLETSLETTRLVNVLVEETAKLSLFVLLELAYKYRLSPLREPSTDTPLPRAGLLALPVLCITAFAVTENITYFLHFPESSIYQRLLYSYPIHLNTAFLYTLAFVSARRLFYPFALLVSWSYHIGLNALSLVLPPLGIYTVGTGNLLLFFGLYWSIRNRSIKRSIEECWNPR